MLFLSAAVVVLTILCLGNLLITFAVLRRLRVHEERFSESVTSSSATSALLGRTLPEFEGTDTRGDAVSRATLAGRSRLVGFFSTTCVPCHEQAAMFARHPDADRVAFVVVRPTDDAARVAMLAALGDTPIVVAGPVGTEVAEEWGIRSFPTLLQVDDTGVVVAAEHSLASLAAFAGSSPPPAPTAWVTSDV